jgi:HPt (histidine-containing phosphotransfer) domain-containing protein
MSVATELSACVLDTDELLARCLGKWDLAQRVLTRFRNQVAGDLLLLQDAVVDGDAGLIAKLAHRIKGAAGNVSARALSDQAAALEDAARQRDWDQIPAHVQSLADERREFEATWQRLSCRGEG